MFIFITSFSFFFKCLGRQGKVSHRWLGCIAVSLKYALVMYVRLPVFAWKSALGKAVVQNGGRTFSVGMERL